MDSRDRQRYSCGKLMLIWIGSPIAAWLVLIGTVTVAFQQVGPLLTVMGALR